MSREGVAWTVEFVRHHLQAAIERERERVWVLRFGGSRR